MPLPDTVPVEIMPEEAGEVSLRPVVVQQMPLAELVDLLVSQLGKHAEKIQRLLREGSIVVGGSRFRWEPRSVPLEEVQQWIAGYPDPDPSRPFLFEECERVVFHARSGRSVAFSRATGMKRRFLARRSFWESLGLLVGKLHPYYRGYSYQERADCYRVELSGPAFLAIRQLARTLAFSALARRLETEELVSVDLYLPRRG